jgi:hypothetical protein
MPTLADFQNTIIVAGSYNGPPAHNPVLRDAAGTAIHNLIMGAVVPLAPGSIFSISVPPAGGAPSLATTPVVGVGAAVPHAGSGGQQIPFVAPAAAGDAVFLPFRQDMICYTLLPANPASNVDFFYTDNLSGCSVFVDRVAGTNDLVVYHANRVSLTATPNPPQYLADTPFPDQYKAARHVMQTDHATAQAALSATLGGVALTDVAILERFHYFACVDQEMNRKRTMGRRNVDVGAAGTNVMGFRIAGAWQFWWQSWAILTYDRPLSAPEVLRSGVHQQLVHGTGELLGVQRFL